MKPWPLSGTQSRAARPPFALPATASAVFLSTALFVGLAILVRGFVLIAARDAPIDMDGSEYVRVAQNLASGHGAVGMRGLPMMTFPLFYSALIALGIRVGASPELVALLIAAVSGVVFAYAAFRLALLMYGPQPAVYAGAIAAMLPICVQTSTTSVAEAPFAALGTLALENVVRFVRGGHTRHAAFAAAAFGGAYLFRPEGALFALTGLTVIVAATVALRRNAAPAAAFVAVLAFFALASLGASYATSGRFSLEGKTSVNFALADGLSRGGSYLSVADAVDAQGRPTGPEIDPRYYTPGLVPAQLAPGRRVALAARAGLRHIGESLRLFSEPTFGGGILIVLAVLGLGGAAWTRTRTRDETSVLVYFVTGFVALAGVWQFWPRYGMILIPVVILWAARGLEQLRRWSIRSRLPDFGIAAFAALMVLSAGMDVALARSSVEPLERDTAAWIRAHGPAAPRIVDVSTLTAFYAGGTWTPLPYGDERAAQRFLREARPAFVVLDSRRAGQYPPLHRWFEEGMPRSIATRVYEARDARGAPALRVYRLNAAGSNRR